MGFKSDPEEPAALRTDDQDHPVSRSTWNTRCPILPSRPAAEKMDRLFYSTTSGMFHVERERQTSFFSRGGGGGGDALCWSHCSRPRIPVTSSWLPPASA